MTITIIHSPIIPPTIDPPLVIITHHLISVNSHRPITMDPFTIINFEPIISRTRLSCRQRASTTMMLSLSRSLVNWYSAYFNVMRLL